MRFRASSVSTAVALCVFASAATAQTLRNTVTDLFRGGAAVAPATAQIEVGFSPEGTAVTLVLKAIRSARVSIHVMAYVMSNPEITGALARAAQSGVQVYVQVDYKQNVTEDRRGSTRNRLNELARAGATVCTIDAFPIFHDKVMVIDGQHVQTGSFNYSTQAARRNSENALVLWNAPQLASQYEAHFRSRIPVCMRWQPS